MQANTRPPRHPRATWQDVEHLVRPTRAERQCVVGWFRQYRQGLVPDLDETSLRTLRMLDRDTTLHSIRGLASTDTWE